MLYIDIYITKHENLTKSAWAISVASTGAASGVTAAPVVVATEVS